jgi:hypothetical protein
LSPGSRDGLGRFDRIAVLVNNTGMGRRGANVDILGGKRVSEQVVQFSRNIAVGASPKGRLDCVQARLSDSDRISHASTCLRPSSTVMPV